MHNPGFPARVCNCMYHHDHHSEPIRSLHRSFTVSAHSNKPHACSGPKAIESLACPWRSSSGLHATLDTNTCLCFPHPEWAGPLTIMISWTRQIQAQITHALFVFFYGNSADLDRQNFFSRCSQIRAEDQPVKLRFVKEPPH